MEVWERQENCAFGGFPRTFLFGSCRSRTVPTSLFIEYHGGEPHWCLGVCNRNRHVVKELVKGRRKATRGAAPQQVSFPKQLTTPPNQFSSKVLRVHL